MREKRKEREKTAKKSRRKDDFCLLCNRATGLFANHADAFLDEVATRGFVHHGDGIVSVADQALTFIVHEEFFATQEVGTRTRTASHEFSGWAHIGPLHVFAFAQKIQAFSHGASDGLISIREVWRID